jgi:hypothetical protein
MMATDNTPKAGLGCTVLLLMGVSLFVGFIFCATIGGLLFPPLITTIAAPIVCDGEFSGESNRYTTDEGGVGYSREFYCQSDPAGPRRDITFLTITVGGLFYSAIAFVLFSAFSLIRWLMPGSQRVAPAVPALAPVGPVPATPPISGGDQTAVRLRQLRELRDSGVLTEQEYATKRAEILSRL